MKISIDRTETQAVDRALLLLRVGFGLSFAWFHGWPKLSGGPERWAQVGGAMQHFGIDWGATGWGLMASLAEFVGALMVAAGILVRPAAAALAGTMVVAAWMHFVTGEGTPAHAFKNIFVFLPLVLAGGGRYTLDRWLESRLAKGDTGAGPALVILLGSTLLLGPSTVAGQTPAPGEVQPSRPGQAAFGAIAEVVSILDADPSTDWTQVDLEALRGHLRDMDEVILRSEVQTRAIDGGIEIEIEGKGAVGEAIGRMIPAHAAELDADPRYRAEAAFLPRGVRLSVQVEGSDDPAEVARIRGLGFAGLLTLGDHHGPHHLMMARGEGHPGGGHSGHSSHSSHSSHSGQSGVPHPGTRH